MDSSKKAFAHLTVDEEADRIGFRGIAARVLGLAQLYSICTTTNPTSSVPPYWAPIEFDSAEGRVELERRVRAVFSSGHGGLHGLHDAFVIKSWCARNLGTDRAELGRKGREEATAVGAFVDPADISHK